MLLAVPFGLAIGVALGMLGGGGAVLAVPVFVYVLGEDVHAATTASLAVVAAAALAGGAGQTSRREVCWPQVAVFAPAAVSGAVAGTLANRAVEAKALLVGFAVLMLAAAWFTWRKAGSSEDDAGGSCPPLRSRRTAGAGLLVGAMTGLFGVGGGFLVVPLLALGLRVPLRRAIGTSLVIVALVSLVALAAHLWRGAELDPGLTLAVGAGCAAGALAGRRLAARTSPRVLGRAFAVLLAGVASYLALANLV